MQTEITNMTRRISHTLLALLFALGVAPLTASADSHEGMKDLGKQVGKDAKSQGEAEKKAAAEKAKSEKGKSEKKANEKVDEGQKEASDKVKGAKDSVPKY